MGFPVELFVDKPIDEEFICSICHDVLKDPVMVNSGCEHVFCRNCITDWNTKSADKNTCPLDRKPISAIIAPPRVLNSLVNKLKLHCQFNKVGCNEILTVEGIVDHEISCRFNPDGITDCQGACAAKIRKIDQGTHKCVEYLLTKVYHLENENAELKRKCSAVESNINKLKAEAAASSSLAGQMQWKPDGIYAFCVYEHPEEDSFLDLKLGDMIEIEKEKCGQNRHIGIKNGVKGFVRVPFVRNFTYDKLMAGFEYAKCVNSKTFESPLMLSFEFNDVIEIICKNVNVPETSRKTTDNYGWHTFPNSTATKGGWLARLRGKYGYFIPSNAVIIKELPKSNSYLIRVHV